MAFKKPNNLVVMSIQVVSPAYLYSTLQYLLFSCGFINPSSDCLSFIFIKQVQMCEKVLNEVVWLSLLIYTVPSCFHSFRVAFVFLTFSEALKLGKNS